MSAVTRRGRRVFRPGLAIYSLPLALSLKPRIVVSQKVDKRSVVRHKLKRRIRHILSSVNLGKLGVVVITKREALDLPYLDLRKHLTTALSHAKSSDS